MTYEKFVKATKADLVNKANECFATAAAAGNLNKPAALLEAQFYVGEIDRRDQNRISRSDFWLEIIVISLIGLEIVFGYFQGRVLDRLEQSASATAKTLTSLAAVTEEMQKTEQRLLALNYEVSSLPGLGLMVCQESSLFITLVKRT